jgi:hypothetical protein
MLGMSVSMCNAAMRARIGDACGPCATMDANDAS